VTVDQATALGLLGESMRVLLLISAPVLGAGLVVGLLASVFQVVTSIQDVNLSSLPRLMAMLAAGYLAFPWIMRTLVVYTTRLFEQLPQLVR
jgi:flagellar biosynthetic protein FliQ